MWRRVSVLTATLVLAACGGSTSPSGSSSGGPFDRPSPTVDDPGSATLREVGRVEFDGEVVLLAKQGSTIIAVWTPAALGEVDEPTSTWEIHVATVDVGRNQVTELGQSEWRGADSVDTATVDDLWELIPDGNGGWWSAAGPERQLVELDPTTLTIRARYDAKEVAPTSATVIGDRVWIASAHERLELLIVDAANHRVDDRIPGSGGDNVCFADGDLWMADVDDHVLRVDSDTKEIVAQVALDEEPTSDAWCVGDRVFVSSYDDASQENLVAQVDPASNGVIRTFDVAPPDDSYSPVVEIDGDGDVAWVAVGLEESDMYLARLDAVSGEVNRYPLEVRPRGMIARGDTVWLAQGNAVVEYALTT